MRLLYIAMAFVFGSFAPTQAGINLRLKGFVGDPALAAFISFAVGTFILFVYLLIMRTPVPPGEVVFKGPWWMWTGGFMGAFFVAGAVIAAPVLGAGTMMCWMVAGQMSASIILDHYGLVGYAVREASPMRIAGAIFVIAGAVIIEKF